MKQVGSMTILSERNLLTLLSKLQMEGSACTIYATDDEGIPFFVKAEPDSVHYDRPEGPPGQMHPATERVLARLKNEPTEEIKSGTV